LAINKADTEENIYRPVLATLRQWHRKLTASKRSSSTRLTSTNNGVLRTTCVCMYTPRAGVNVHASISERASSSERCSASPQKQRPYKHPVTPAASTVVATGGDDTLQKENESLRTQLHSVQQTIKDEEIVRALATRCVHTNISRIKPHTQLVQNTPCVSMCEQGA
jgi:hypothetical protein